MLRVGLLWHSLASGNLGVRALTLAQLAILEQAAEAGDREVEAVVFGHPDWGAPPISYAGGRVTLGAPVELTARAIFGDTRRLLSDLRRCDLLIDIGEGDSFTDVYGWRRYVKQMATKALALRSGRPFLLAPQTVGPFGPFRRAVPGALLERMDAVFARDAESAAFTRRIAPRARVGLATDVAFLLPWRPPPAAGDGRIRIGINVSGLLYRQGAFGLAVPYAALVDALLAEWTGRPELEVHLIGHVLAPPGDPDQDILLCEDLARRFAGLSLAPVFSDPREAKSWIAGLDFFVGARMHACIAAFSAGVPLVPLAYTRKATGLFRSLGYGASVDLASGTLDGALASVRAAFADRDGLRASIAEGNRRVAALLDGYVGTVRAMVAAA